MAAGRALGRSAQRGLLERALEAEACLNLLELDLVFDVRLHLLCVGTFELLSCCCLQRQARRPVSLYGAVR